AEFALGYFEERPLLLTGKNGYRLRVGDYRILYTINSEDKRIDTYSVAHRKEVY
ncbi:unnamed protein product, partial [marine sediment metagenome]